MIRRDFTSASIAFWRKHEAEKKAIRKQNMIRGSIMLALFPLIIILCFLIVPGKARAAGLADLKFGQYQIADSQWNVSACMYTTTCEIYSTNPGIAYKIPWTSGQLSWAAGDYVSFVATGDAANPFNAIQYASNGVQKAVMGTGHIINMGNDFFFFVGNDNDTVQLFSMTSGLSSSAGMTWTGTLNPTIDQVNAYAANGSTTPLASGQTAAPAAPPGLPPLCCGGSAAQFNADAANVSKVMTFVNRATADSKVNITQIGNDSTITVDQSGTKNNYASYHGTGSNNTVSITQSGNNQTQANYVDLTVTGNTNYASITQTSTGGAKGVFANVQDNNNHLTVQQTDSGSHYAQVNLQGSNKNVDITQSGTASHMASISLSGQPVGLSLQQTGATQQFYSIQFNCATAGGCAPIQVKQGN